MCEDPLELAIKQVREITPEEISMEQPATEPDSTAPGSDDAELFSRGGSAPLLVDDVGEDTDYEFVSHFLFFLTSSSFFLR